MSWSLKLGKWPGMTFSVVSLFRCRPKRNASLSWLVVGVVGPMEFRRSTTWMPPKMERRPMPTLRKAVGIASGCGSRKDRSLPLSMTSRSSIWRQKVASLVSAWERSNTAPRLVWPHFKPSPRFENFGGVLLLIRTCFFFQGTLRNPPTTSDGRKEWVF